MFSPAQGSEIKSRLRNLGHPLTFDAFNDPAGTVPGLSGNGLKYYLGDSFGQGGAALGDIDAQLDLAKATRLIPRAIVLSVGTNSLAFDATKQAAHLALIQKIKAYWPTASVAVGNIRAVGPTKNTGTRITANIVAANVMIAANVAAVSGVTLVDSYTAYANRGSAGVGATADYGDDLHPSIKGGQAAGSTAWATWLATFPSQDVIANRRIATVMTSGLISFAGADTAVNIAGGGAGNTGTITGLIATGWALFKVGNVASNIVCSTVSNPTTGGKSLKIDVTTVAGNAQEQFGLRPAAINADTTTGLAGKWFELIARIRDDRALAWQTATTQWLERSNTANNFGTDQAGMYDDGGSSQRTTVLVTPPFKGVSTSTGHQSTVSFRFDPAITGTHTLYIDEVVMQTRTAPKMTS